MAQVRQPLPPQIPILPDAVRFQSSPVRPAAGQYGPPSNASGQYTGSPARPMAPQQSGAYPPPQMMNRPPPPAASAQMMNRPPPPTVSAQMMNRPPPPAASTQMGTRPPLPVAAQTQMVNRPPAPGSTQMVGHPSAQIGQRMPGPQIGSQPPSQLPSRRPSEAPHQVGTLPGSNFAGQGPPAGMTNGPGSNLNSNFQHSQVMSPASNRVPSGDQQLPPSVSNTASPFLQRSNELPYSKFNERDISSGIRTVSDDDALSMVSMNKKHLPVYARFPFDVTFLSQPMNMTVDNSIQDLRHRLIESVNDHKDFSELNHQRRTTDEYIKRTHRIGVETDPETQMDLERELEIQKIQASLNSGRRSRPPILLSDYGYEPRRAPVQPLSDILEGQPFATTNMDDLIDSMARRHLSERRYISANQRHSGVGGHSPYFESSPLGRRITLRSQQRPEDIYFANKTPTSFLEHDIIRLSPEIFNETLRGGSGSTNQPQLSNVDHSSSNDSMRNDSSIKLPRIPFGTDTNHLNQPSLASNSTLYLAKHNLQGYSNYHTVPMNLPAHTEHL
ncbi:unnamed protein product, partial [Adineta ricciae]